jgi:sterol desaturase/sphingolipid hydroxylase (fatty acid hydroxylase superfamily)
MKARSGVIIFSTLAMLAALTCVFNTGRVEITIVVALVLASTVLCSALTTLAYARMPSRRQHRDDQRKAMGAELRQRLVVNSLVSVTVVFGLTHLFADRLFSTEASPLWRSALQVAAILALYDILFYFVHPHLFHGWSALRRLHAVHHRVRYPTTIESLFQHPLEIFLSLSLLMLCTWVVGPVHVYAFGACFFFYSWVSIILHAGVELPIPYLGLVARKHAIHHVDMRAGNYASLSPLPDLLFGTAE